jgi:NAD(P)-dependent dehydrogenase (short-subunit alcohol dehydrogenase family)
MKLFRLDDEVVFVTGAGSGIGQAIAVGLAEAGAHVACFDLPGSATQPDTLARIRKLERRALDLRGNVTSATDMAAAIARTEQELGPVVAAVNCAGIANGGAAEDMPFEQWQKVMEVNLTGIFHSCQAEARVMLGRRRGSIVNIGSISGGLVNRGLCQAHYNASKAGVIHYSRSVAMEWAERGVRVNCISPGYTLTPMNLRPDVAEQTKKFAAETPMKRMAVPDEMVGAAVFLSSRAASFVTGINLLVDGGFSCW